MNAPPKPLKFDSFSVITLPAGTFIFFPEWNAKDDASSKEPINSVVFKVSKRRKRLQGAVVGSSLFVIVDQKRFNRFSNELRQRELRERPITFDFELNERGALTELRADCNEFKANKSDVTSIAGGKGRPASK